MNVARAAHRGTHIAVHPHYDLDAIGFETLCGELTAPLSRVKRQLGSLAYEPYGLV